MPTDEDEADDDDNAVPIDSLRLTVQKLGPTRMTRTMGKPASTMVLTLRRGESKRPMYRNVGGMPDFSCYWNKRNGSQKP